MTMRIAIILLLTAVAATAQTSSTLRQKYGQPTDSETYKGRPTSETYKVRPDIKVSVEYTKGGDVCEMFIEPVSGTKDGKPPLLKSQPLDEVIDELAPKESRGKHLMDTFLDIVCLPRNDCFGVDWNYQKLAIHVHGSTDAHPFASIRWRHRTCAQLAEKKSS
jgi:hypothetical protein